MSCTFAYTLFIGTIVRKLPRKVDVLEGENAAFCVEVEEEEMDIHWYKDGTELRETHQTILKSFGRTHILVFVNTTPQDSGMVIFYVGRSKTSSQLRVKGQKLFIFNQSSDKPDDIFVLCIQISQIYNITFLPKSRNNNNLHKHTQKP